ncbi:MAG: hypothetical protein NXI32_31300 [bacterium]|nr:hypothetical protein [bacterium]
MKLIQSDTYQEQVEVRDHIQGLLSKPLNDPDVVVAFEKDEEVDIFVIAIPGRKLAKGKATATFAQKLKEVVVELEKAIPSAKKPKAEASDDKGT